MKISVKAKAIVISGDITVTTVSPSPEVKPAAQLDIFPIEMSDKLIAFAGGFDEEVGDKGQEIKEVTISWEE